MLVATYDAFEAALDQGDEIVLYEFPLDIRELREAVERLVIARFGG